MRYVFGKLTDRTKQYWPMTIAGYLLDVLAVPALALETVFCNYEEPGPWALRPFEARVYLVRA